MGKLSQLNKALKTYKKQLDSVSEQGYAIRWYHGTAGDIRPDEIDPNKFGSVTESEAAKRGFFLHSDQNAARGFAEEASRKTGMAPRVDEFYYRPTRQAEIDWQEYANIPARSDGGQMYLDAALEDLSDQGAGSLLIRNTDDAMSDGVKGDVLVSIDGKGLRYSDAAFAPAKKDSANLLAGTAAAGIGTGALLGSDEANASILGRDEQALIEQAVAERSRRANRYIRRRQNGGRSPQLQKQINTLKAAIFAGLERMDMPMQFMQGQTAFMRSLAEGDGIQGALTEGLRQGMQPIEQNAYERGAEAADVTGSPAVGTAVNVLNQVVSPI
jgi:hypothetical protein